MHRKRMKFSNYGAGILPKSVLYIIIKSHEIWGITRFALKYYSGSAEGDATMHHPPPRNRVNPMMGGVLGGGLSNVFRILFHKFLNNEKLHI